MCGSPRGRTGPPGPGEQSTPVPTPLLAHSHQLSQAVEQGVLLDSCHCFLTFQSQPVAAPGTDSILHPNWRHEPELSAGTSRCKKSNQSQIAVKEQGLCFEMILWLIWTLQNRDYQKADTNDHLPEYLKVGTGQAYAPKWFADVSTKVSNTFFFFVTQPAGCQPRQLFDKLIVGHSYKFLFLNFGISFHLRM